MKYSKMSGKLKGIESINTSPTDNEFCTKLHESNNTICEKCYSIKMLATYRHNCEKPFRENGEELAETLLDKFPKIHTELFRINSHGELRNLTHARNMLRLAKQYPGVRVGFWTKRSGLAQRAMELEGKPDNVIMIKSSLHINKQDPLPEGFDKVFTVYDYDNGQINCGANKCDGCRLCYTHNGVTNINELLK